MTVASVTVTSVWPSVTRVNRFRGRQGLSWTRYCRNTRRCQLTRCHQSKRTEIPTGFCNNSHSPINLLSAFPFRGRHNGFSILFGQELHLLSLLPNACPPSPRPNIFSSIHQYIVTVLLCSSSFVFSRRVSLWRILHKHLSNTSSSLHPNSLKVWLLAPHWMALPLERPIPS